MAQTFNYDGSALANVIRKSVSLTEKADHGDPGTGSLTIDDDAGTTAIVGHKSFTARQTSCTDTRTFDGYIRDRRYKRGETEYTGAGRQIDITVVDSNARLGFKVIRGSTGTRPSETISARLTWLLASSFLSGLVADNGFVSYPTTVLDKNDYRGQYPFDVLRDMALVAGYNFFVYPDPTTGAASLWFADSNTSTNYTSTLSISNDKADVDSSTVFAPFHDTELSRDPSQVVSGVFMPFRRGNVYRTRAATETTFQARDGVAPSADVKTRNRARTRADRYLTARSHEEDLISTTVRLTAAKVNLVRAGMRVQVKFSHFATEGFGSYSYFRVLERTVSHPLNDDNTYDVKLQLSPQGDSIASMIQCASTVSAAETTVTLGSNVTVGNLLVSRLITRNSETIPEMQAGQGWTLLGSGAATGLNTHGAVAMYAKIATSTSPTIGREATAAQIQMTVCEISGANLGDITAYSTTHRTSSSWSPGSGSGRIGLFIVAIPRGNDGLGNGYTVSPTGSWTVEKNQDIDNAAACAFAPADPWWWAAKIENQASVDLAVSITAGLCGGQTLAEWCAAAIFV